MSSAVFDGPHDSSISIRTSGSGTDCASAMHYRFNMLHVVGVG